MVSTTTRTLRHVPVADGRPLLEGRMLLKVSADDSDDAYTLCLGLTPVGLGPPLHLHAFDDQTHYVVRGTYELIAGPDVTVAGPGACVHMPRFTPHTFRNVGDEPAELVEFTAPGGIDRYFDAVAHLGPVAKDLEARNAIGRRFGMSFPTDPEDYLEPPPGETRRPLTVVGSGEGRRLDWPGCEAIRKIDAADTDGSHSLTDITLPAGATAPLAAAGGIAVVVLDGVVTVRAGSEWVEAGPGDTVAVPPLGEAVAEAGPEQARFIVYAIEASS
jgi:mannose-6-phosphate isomerase-like protein (cupin superfamily)